MRRPSKIAYPVLVVGLATLAIWPHWPKLQEQARHLYNAWTAEKQKHANTTTTDNLAEEAEKSPLESPRRTPISPETLSPEIPTGSETTDRFIAEVRDRAIKNPEEAMQWLQLEYIGTERIRGMLEVVALWAAKDSESAMLWIESNAQGLARLETLTNGIETWAKAAPREAAAWIDGMANDGSKVTAARSLATTWGKQDPQNASKWISEFPSGDLRNEAALALIQSWTEQSPQAASTWAFAEVELGGQEHDPKLLEEAIRIYTQNDPASARDYLYEITEAKQYPTVIASHVEAMVENDPRQTADWLGSLAEDDPLNHPANTRFALSSWAETDSVAASTWLSEQPQGKHRDLAITGFVQSVQHYDPAIATAWADTISDPVARLTSLEKSILQWKIQDATSANDWLEQSQLEPSLRQHLGEVLGESE